MNVIVCVDDSRGMLFNRRRQSKDIVLTKRVTALAEASEDSRLWIHPFSLSLFAGIDCRQLVADEAFLDKAGKGDFCFVENCGLLGHADKIEELYVFKWNRTYPSDFSLDLDLSGWKLAATEGFAGNSHEKITMEVYGK